MPIATTAIRMIEACLTDADKHASSVSHVRLWQLISPGLPIGAFAYSQSLEYVVNAGWVTNETAMQDWLFGLLGHNLCYLDLPVFARLYRAWQHQDENEVLRWNGVLQASRESGELLTEDRQIGQALMRLLADLDVNTSIVWESAPPSFITAFTLAAAHWRIPLPVAAQGWLWSWCEHQVAAAVKLIPLGQTAGQRILSSVAPRIILTVTDSERVQDADIGAIAPRFAIASALHETQYSRLFRS
jgi:urease accessory protein